MKNHMEAKDKRPEQTIRAAAVWPKVLLFVSGTLVLLWFIGVPVIDALLDFSFGGIVPGTDAVLSPDTVIWSVVIILMFACIVLLATLVYRHFMIKVARLGGVSDEPTQLEDQPPLDDEPGALPAAVYPHMKRRYKARLFYGEAVMALGNFCREAGFWLQDFTRQATPVINDFLSKLGRRTMVVVSRIAAATVAAWQWASPYLWRLDSWLEVQVRSAESWLSKHAPRSELMQFLATITREYKKSLVSVGRSPLWPRTRRAWVEFKKRRL